MTPRTVLVLAALAAAFAPSSIAAQSGVSNRLRESKLETYMARAQTALGRLEDELKEEHIDGARVAAKELRQALAALEKTRRSGGKTPGSPFDQLLLDRATSRPTNSQNADLLNSLLRESTKSRPSQGKNPFDRLNVQKKSKARDMLLRRTTETEPEAPSADFLGKPPERADAPNALRQLFDLHEQKTRDRSELETGDRALRQLLENTQTPPEDPAKPVKGKGKRADRKPHEVMAAEPPAAYRELELDGQTVIVPEKLLGEAGEVTRQGGQLIIRKGDA